MMYKIIVQREQVERKIYEKTVEVASSKDLDELLGFVSAGIEAYEDWKVNGE